MRHDRRGLGIRQAAGIGERHGFLDASMKLARAALRPRLGEGRPHQADGLPAAVMAGGTSAVIERLPGLGLALREGAGTGLRNGMRHPDGGGGRRPDGNNACERAHGSLVLDHVCSCRRFSYCSFSPRHRPGRREDWGYTRCPSAARLPAPSHAPAGTSPTDCPWGRSGCRE